MRSFAAPPTIVSAACALACVVVALAVAGCGSTNKRSPQSDGDAVTSGGTGATAADPDTSSGDGDRPSTPVQPSDPATPIETGAPRDSAKVYWVGHSLISHEDHQRQGSRNLMDLLGEMASAAGQQYGMYPHTTPGAPLYWNWGINDQAWADDVRDKIPPLVDPNHADYGSFDVIVVTESIPVTLVYDFQHSGFYARRFFCAARRANPNVELYVYESWPHSQAGDPGYAKTYGAQASFDFVAFLRSERAIWDAIADDASDPSRRPTVPEDYRWSGEGEDPGQCDGALPVRIVPTGTALASLLDRLGDKRAGDDWSYGPALVGGQLSQIDLFQNPLTNFPQDTSTTAFGGDIDDIHASAALAYFNSLVHYATIYRRDPAELPTANGVPANIANIMKEVAWAVVSSDPRTGVSL